jgi:predicted GNAT family acetyltransferase
VTYLARAGVISTVAVDRRYRRRGFARALLARAHAEIRRSGRAYAVLQVLEENAPAQRLYRALGYRNLRASSVLFRDAPAPVPVPSLGSAELRPFRPSDASALAEIFNSQLPPEVRDVVPATTELFSPSPFLVRATRSESEAWVLANAGRPLGYVRATVGGISRSANLSQPVLAAEADAEASLALVGTALAWIRARGMARTVVEVPEGLTLARATLAAAGFVPGYALDTLVFDLPMA